MDKRSSHGGLSLKIKGGNDGDGGDAGGEGGVAHAPQVKAHNTIESDHGVHLLDTKRNLHIESSRTLEHDRIETYGKEHVGSYLRPRASRRT